MNLDDKIRAKKVAYILTKDVSSAYELSLLYYVQARRKTTEDKIVNACRRSIYWLGQAGISISEKATQFSSQDLICEIEMVLVENKAMICRPDKAVFADSLVRAYCLASA